MEVLIYGMQFPVVDRVAQPKEMDIRYIAPEAQSRQLASASK